jgi:hypothetical protein
VGRLRLRGYGNAIVPQVAATFIRAFLTSETVHEARTGGEGMEGPGTKVLGEAEIGSAPGRIRTSDPLVSEDATAPENP